MGQLEIHVYNLLEKKNNKLGYIIYLPKEGLISIRPFNFKEHGFNLFFAYYISSSVAGFWYIMIYMHMR